MKRLELIVGIGLVLVNVAIAALWPPGQFWAIPLLFVGLILIFVGCKKWIFGEKPQKLDLDSAPSTEPTLPQKTVPSAVRQQTVRRPHFEFVGLGRPNLYMSYIPQEGVRPPATDDQAQNSLPGVTLRFTNLAKEGESLRALDVVARLRLFAENWVHFQDVDYGVWVGSSCEVTDMEVGDVRELVLFLIDIDNQLAGMKDLRHVGTFQFGENYLEPFKVDWVRYVEVILTDQRSHATRGWVFEIQRQGTAFTTREAYPPPQAARLPQ